MSAAIVHTPREQWLLARSERVTATDAADLICHALGEDAYRAPAEILAAKWGLCEDAEASEPMKWGNRLQRVIGEVYAEETGREVIPVPEYEIWQHAEFPWLSASGDATFALPGESDRPLEIKTDGSRWHDGSAPIRHQVQNLIQQSCLGVDSGAVTAFVDRFRPLVSQDVPFSRRFFDSCLPLLEEFHHYLQTRTMPTDPKWYTKAAVKAFWPNGNGSLVALDHDDLRLVSRWERLKLFRKWAEEQKDRCEVALAVRLGDAESGLLPDGSSYRLKRSLVAAQSCECGRVLRHEHTRAVPSRYWPKHLKPASKALTGITPNNAKE